MPGTFKVRYANGPIIKPSDRTDLPPYTVITYFRSEIAENPNPTGAGAPVADDTFGFGVVRAVWITWPSFSGGKPLAPMPSM